MEGLRVLLHRKNSLKPFFVPLLQEARKRWNWHIDVLCEAGEHPDYADSISSSGKIYVLPDMRRSLEWEFDERAVLETNKQIRQAEIAAGMSLNRLPLANQRDIGAAYVAPNWNVKDTSFVKKILQDNMEPFRVARRFFRNVDDILAESAPDLILTYEWGKPFRFATWLAAAGRGIPCVAVRRSKILSDRGFCTTHPLLFNVAAMERARDRIKSNVAVAPLPNETNNVDARLSPEFISYLPATSEIVFVKK